MFRRDPVKSAEAEIINLTTRREGVLARLADATAKAEAASAEQRRLLIETDGADAGAVRKAGDACRRTEDNRAALADAARVLAELIADAQATAAAERDRRERNRQADTIAAQVDGLGAILAEMETKAAELGATFAAFRALSYRAIPRTAPDFVLGPEGFIGTVSDKLLATIMPVRFQTPVAAYHADAAPETITDAARPTLGALAAQAETIRSGPPVLPASVMCEAA